MWCIKTGAYHDAGLIFFYKSHISRKSKNEKQMFKVICLNNFKTIIIYQLASQIQTLFKNLTDISSLILSNGSEFWINDISNAHIPNEWHSAWVMKSWNIRKAWE